MCAWFPLSVSCLTCPGPCWVCLLAQSLHALPRLPYPTSFLMSLSIPLPVPPHPTARLWRGAGLASLSITEAGWVTSAKLDSPLWWVGTLGRWCICKETYEGHTDGTWPHCWWKLNWLKRSTTAHKKCTRSSFAHFNLSSFLSSPSCVFIHHASLSLSLPIPNCVCRCSISGFRFGRFMELAQGSRAQGWGGDRYIYITGFNYC